MNNESLEFNSKPVITEQPSTTESPGDAISEVVESKRRLRQISLLAMRDKPTSRSRNSWLNTVGKYPEGSPVDTIFEEGSKLRVKASSNFGEHFLCG